MGRLQKLTQVEAPTTKRNTTNKELPKQDPAKPQRQQKDAMTQGN